MLVTFGGLLEEQVQGCGECQCSGQSPARVAPSVTVPWRALQGRPQGSLGRTSWVQQQLPAKQNRTKVAYGGISPPELKGAWKGGPGSGP